MRSVTSWISEMVLSRKIGQSGRIKKILRDNISDLQIGFRLLTRLPVGCPNLFQACPILARTVWTWPLVGIVVGLLGGGTTLVLLRWGSPVVLALIWGSIIQLLVTGGLHEDGMADAADGLGSGKDMESRLAIMHDDRVGNFGVLALICLFCVRLVALTISIQVASLSVLSIFILIAVSSRAAMLMVTWYGKPATPQSIAISLYPPRKLRSLISILITLVVILAILPLYHVIILVIILLVVAVMMRALSDQMIGGYTGDILGATCIVAEMTVLTLISSIF